MLTAMARELVTEKGIGEPVAAIWRQIQAEHSNVVAPTSITPEPTPVIAEAPLTTSLVTPALAIAAASNALKFGSRPPSAHPAKRSEALPADGQFPLF